MRPTLLSALAALVSTSALAAQLQVTPDELCTVSDTVVLAEVTSMETRWAAHSEAGAIERIAWLTVDDVVKGAPATDLRVVLPGGQLGEAIHWVEDVPRLLKNGRYLLFLDQQADGWHVVGGDQGAVRILPTETERGTTETKALASVEVCRD